MPRYSLDNPHPRHQPTVRHYHRGNSPTTGRAEYGTEVFCSCHPDGRQRCNNGAPHSGAGKAFARQWYRQHLAGARPQVPLTFAQWYLLRRIHDADPLHAGNNPDGYHPLHERALPGVPHPGVDPGNGRPHPARLVLPAPRR